MRPAAHGLGSAAPPPHSEGAARWVLGLRRTRVPFGGAHYSQRNPGGAANKRAAACAAPSFHGPLEWRHRSTSRTAPPRPAPRFRPLIIPLMRAKAALGGPARRGHHPTGPAQQGSRTASSNPRSHPRKAGRLRSSSRIIIMMIPGMLIRKVHHKIATKTADPFSKKKYFFFIF